MGSAESRFDGLRSRRVAGVRVPVAERFVSRLLGLALLDRTEAGAGLLIPRCRCVHTFGMRFALDLVFLDPEVARSVASTRSPPHRVVRERRADAVLELPAGCGQKSRALIRISPDGGSSPGDRSRIRSSIRLSRGSRASSHANIARAEPTASTSAAPIALASGPASR